MAVERLGDGLFEFGPRHLLLGQPFEQHLALVEKPGRAIAALERKVLDEALLQRRQLAALGVPLDRADRFAVEADRRRDAGRVGVAGPVGVVDDHRAAQALRRAATELRAGHAEVLAQEIVHRQFVAHLDRAMGAAVDGQGEARHESAPFSIFSVTGSDWKRLPVASKIAFSSAAATGIMPTSAAPFGASFASTGGSSSISRSCSGRSEPRAMTYSPRFHCPLPG